MKQNIATERRRQELEQQFQDNKDVILADVTALDLSVAELTAKYGVSEKVLRRWMERLGVDSLERILARRRAGLENRPKARPMTQKPTEKRFIENRPQAHKLVGLW